MDDPLWTVEQLAEYWQVKLQTIRDAVWRGKIPCVKLWRGKKKSLLRFKRSEIEEFIRQKSLSAKTR